MNEQIGASPELASGKANLGHALETCVMLELERRGAVNIPAEITLDAAWNWLLQGNASV